MDNSLSMVKRTARGLAEISKQSSPAQQARQALNTQHGYGMGHVIKYAMDLK